MKIELRKFKSYPARSEETLNFTADVYIDERRVGTVENEGRGGMNFFRGDAPGMAQVISDYAKTLPPSEVPGYGTVPMTADILFGDLAEEMEEKRLAALDKKRRAKFADKARAAGKVPYVGTFESPGSKHEVMFWLSSANAEVAAAETKRVAARKKGSFNVATEAL